MTETYQNKYISPSPAVEQAAEIIRYLSSSPHTEASLTDIARAIGIAMSKSHSLLAALQRFNFVTKNAENRLYSLGWGLIPPGQQALHNIDYGDITKPFLNELAAKTKCTALFGLARDKHLVITAMAQLDQAVESRLKVGRVLSLYHGVLGKVIAASLPKKEQEELFKSEQFREFWNPSEYNYCRIRKQLAVIHHHKYIAHVLAGQKKPIIKLLASAVLGSDSFLIGVLFIVGIISAADRHPYGMMLAGVAEQMSRRMGNWRGLEEMEINIVDNNFIQSTSNNVSSRKKITQKERRTV